MRMIVNIDVPELAPAIAFYSDALGLKLNRILDDDVAELSGASSSIYLLASAAGSAPASSVTEKRRYSRHWTPVHIDFVVDDIVASATRAIKAGATQESECIEWRGSRCITFSDPFGHGFCLIAFAGETYDDGPA
jgi:predicted enzyme related to lactoylglutathione lyase